MVRKLFIDCISNGFAFTAQWEAPIKSSENHYHLKLCRAGYYEQSLVSEHFEFLVFLHHSSSEETSSFNFLLFLLNSLSFKAVLGIYFDVIV